MFPMHGMVKGLLVSLVALLGFAVPVGGASSENQDLRLATLEWEPYVGSNLKDEGLIPALVRAALLAGQEGDLRITFLPWARVLKEGEAGHFDGIFPAYYSDERAKTFVYSDPIAAGPLVLYRKSDLDIVYTGSLEELRPYTIGIGRGYVNTKEFDEAAFLKKEITSSDEQNIRKLMAGRLDLIVIDQVVAEHLLGTLFADRRASIAPLDPPLEMKPVYVAFGRHLPDAGARVARFNEALRAIRTNGTWQAVLRSHGYECPSRFDPPGFASQTAGEAHD